MMEQPTSPRPRVLFLSDHLGYADGVIHGATRYFLNVLPRIDPQKIDLTVCFLRDRHPAVQQLQQQGIEPIFLNRAKWDPRSLSDLTRLIRERDIELLHLAGMKGCLIGRIAARLTHRRAIIHLHDTRSPGLVIGTLQRRVARWTDLALAVSAEVGRLATHDFAIPPQRVQVLHNGIVLSDFTSRSSEHRQQVRQEIKLTPQMQAIGVIGRLAPEKNHAALIGVMPAIL